MGILEIFALIVGVVIVIWFIGGMILAAKMKRDAIRMRWIAAGLLEEEEK